MDSGSGAPPTSQFTPAAPPPPFDHYEAALHRLAAAAEPSSAFDPSRLPQHRQQTTLDFNGQREGSPRLFAPVDSHDLYAPAASNYQTYTTTATTLQAPPEDYVHPALRRLSLVTASSNYSPHRNSNPLATFDQFLPSTTLTAEAQPQRPTSLGVARDSFKRLLRQSTEIASQNIQMEIETRLRDENGTTPKPRLSDEANGNVARTRKKSGFAKLVNSMLGSPKPTISAPMNPVHITRVGYDHQTGQFTVRLQKQDCAATPVFYLVGVNNINADLNK